MILPTTIFLFLIISISTKPIPQLTPSKLQKAIAQNQFTLVYFYSAQCGFCKEFTPKFQQISKVLGDSQVSFGKLDGPAYPQITEKYQIFSYPTIALFWKNIDYPIFYYKQRQTEVLLNFIKQTTQLNKAQIEQKKYNQLQDTIKKQGIFFRGPKDSYQFRVMTVLSYVEPYRPFIRIADSKQDPSLQIKGIKHTNFEINQLITTIRKQFAKVHIIDEQSWLGIHQKRKPGIIFVDTNKNKDLENKLQVLAKQYPHVVFLKIDPSQQQFEPALDALGIEQQQQIMGTLVNADAMFQASPPHTQQSLKQFMEKFLNLTWPVYRKSERAGDSLKLTRNNYQQKINVDKDVIIFLYKQQDKIRRKFLQLFKYVAKKMKVNKNLAFYRCNLSKNEIQEKIGFIPKVTPSVFYLRHRMKDYPIHFTHRSLTPETIIQFIMENTTFDWEDSWMNLEQL